MLNNTVIDFLIVCWITATVMLLYVFARYARRCALEDGWRAALSKTSFFNGLIIHHIGNLTLLVWFWLKIHRGDIVLQMEPMDTWVIITGSAIACCGVLYKVRIFTSTAQEVVFTSALTLLLSAISIIFFL